MTARRPASTVTIGGIDQTALEWSTQHSVEAPLAQASIVLPSPPPTGVFEGAVARIKVKGDTSEDLLTVFEGRVRGPLEWNQTDSDATITARCDGNLWRMTFPATYDMSWVGPITPRKLIRQFLAFRGITDYHVEEFVDHRGVPILLGGVPWFDDGRVVCPEGTSPLDFVDRICRLFGYRIYDRPDGRVRVSRVCGPPRQPDYTLEEGVDLLGPSKDVDLHNINTYITMTGASGTDPSGAQISIVSRPKRGIHSAFIPNPPKYAASSESDPLLVSQLLADQARIVKEFDQAGPAWHFSSEVIGASRGALGLAPNQVFAAKAPTIGLVSTGKRFWQISVSNSWGSQGFWTTLEGWRPTGKPARSAPPEPVDDPTDPPTSAPSADDLGSTPDPATGDLTGDDTPLPTGYDVAPDDPLYDSGTDPDGAAPTYDGSYDPTSYGPGAPGFDDPTSTDQPYIGPTPFCPPPAAAPPVQCQTAGLLEPGWDTDLSGGALSLDFTVPITASDFTITGEAIGTGGDVTITQDAAVLGTTTRPDADPVNWEAFSVTITAAADVGTAQLGFASSDGSVRGVDVQICGGRPCAIPTPPPPAGCPDCADEDWSTDRPVTWDGGATVSVTDGVLTFGFAAENDGTSAACDATECDASGDWTLVVDGQTSGPEQSVSAFVGEFWTESGDVPPFTRYSPYVRAVWGGTGVLSGTVGVTPTFRAFETDGFDSTFVMDDNTAGYALQPDTTFRLTIFKTGDAHFQYVGEQPIGTTIFDFEGDGTGSWDDDVAATLADPAAVTTGRRIGVGVWWSEGVTGATDGDAEITNVSFFFGGG